MNETPHYDLAIVGAGPGGSSAAIFAALRGLSVILIDHHQSSTLKPGESLPPGIESIFKQLGIWETIEKMQLIRHPGHYVAHDDKSSAMEFFRDPSHDVAHHGNDHAYSEDKIANTPQFIPYGEDENGVWHDIQIPRSILNQIMHARVKELNVTIKNNCHIKKITQLSSHTCLETDMMQNQGTKANNKQNQLIDAHHKQNQFINARYVIDATGMNHLFARKLNIKLIPYSKKLIAKYGYIKNHAPYPHLPVYIHSQQQDHRQHQYHWRWYAKIESDCYAWVEVAPHQKQTHHQSQPDPHPISGGADVTWRIAEKLAGESFFLIGDAACVIDPSCGHGVLRALMSGMMASHAIAKIIREEIAANEAYNEYSSWLRNWFLHDVNELRYRMKA